MITDLCAKFYVNQWQIWLLMRQCPLKYKGCPLKRPLSGRAIRSFEIRAAKATNRQKNGSAEDSIMRGYQTNQNFKAADHCFPDSMVLIDSCWQNGYYVRLVLFAFP